MSKADTKEHLEHLEDTGSPNSIHEINIDDLDSIEQTKTGKFSWLVSITAAIGGMLFGYDTGIISAVLVCSFYLSPLIAASGTDVGYRSTSTKTSARLLRLRRKNSSPRSPPVVPFWVPSLQDVLLIVTGERLLSMWAVSSSL